MALLFVAEGLRSRVVARDFAGDLDRCLLPAAAGQDRAGNQFDLKITVGEVLIASSLPTGTFPCCSASLARRM